MIICELYSISSIKQLGFWSTSKCSVKFNKIAENDFQTIDSLRQKAFAKELTLSYYSQQALIRINQ